MSKERHASQHRHQFHLRTCRRTWPCSSWTGWRSPAERGLPLPGGDAWESVTWKQAGDEVARLAAGLLALGIEPEQRVGIASGTRYEWILADLAIMCAGAATTTVYPTTNEEDTAYILADSECRVVFAEDDEQIAKLTARKSELPHVAKVVTFDGTADGDWVIDLDDARERSARSTSPSTPASSRRPPRRSPATSWPP